MSPTVRPGVHVLPDARPYAILQALPDIAYKVAFTTISSRTHTWGAKPGEFTLSRLKVGGHNENRQLRLKRRPIKLKTGLP